MRETQDREFSYKAHLTREQHALRMVHAESAPQKTQSEDNFYAAQEADNAVSQMDPETVDLFAEQNATGADLSDDEKLKKKRKGWIDTFPFTLLKYPFFIPILMYKFLSGGISEATDELASRAAPIKKIYGL